MPSAICCQLLLPFESSHEEEIVLRHDLSVNALPFRRICRRWSDWHNQSRHKVAIGDLLELFFVLTGSL